MRRGSWSACEKAAGTRGALPGTDSKPTESLGVKIREQTNVGDVVVGACYGLPGQEVAIFRLLEEGASCSPILVLVIGLNLHSIS